VINVKRIIELVLSLFECIVEVGAADVFQRGCAKKGLRIILWIFIFFIVRLVVESNSLQQV